MSERIPRPNASFAGWMAAVARLLSFALRNLSRNRRRSALTLVAVGLGAAAMVLLRGLSDGFVAMMIGELVGGRTAAIQVHRAGYRRSAEVLPTALNLPHDHDTIARLSRVPGVRGVAGRIRFGGLLSNGATDAAILGRGVDPAAEARACPNFGKDVLPGGRTLRQGDFGHAVLGVELATAMGAWPPRDGQAPYLALSATSPEGRANALGVEATGAASLRLPFESKRSVVVPLPLAQELLGLHGRVTEYALSVERIEEVEEVASRLRSELGAGYEVHTWRELEPYVRDVIRRQRMVLAVFGLVLLAVVLSGIANTLLMSVHERTSEIGTLMAVGMRRRGILLLFAAEATLLGAIGGIAGALLGKLAVLALGARGIQFDILDVSVVLRPRVGLGFAFLTAGICCAAALLSAAWPALKASRLRPVDALRQE